MPHRQTSRILKTYAPFDPMGRSPDSTDKLAPPMIISSDPTRDRNPTVGLLLLAAVLALPVLMEPVEMADQGWKMLYLGFIATVFLFGLISVDVIVADAGLYRRIRFCGLRLVKRQMVARDSLRAVERTSTARYDHVGVGSQAVVGYVHRVELLTQDGLRIPLMDFEHLQAQPAELVQALASISHLLGLPICEAAVSSPPAQQ